MKPLFTILAVLAINLLWAQNNPDATRSKADAKVERTNTQAVEKNEKTIQRANVPAEQNAAKVERTNTKAAEKNTRTVQKAETKSTKQETKDNKKPADGRTKTGDKIDHSMKGPNGETIYTGERGGKYYLDKSGNKKYIKQ